MITLENVGLFDSNSGYCLLQHPCCRVLHSIPYAGFNLQKKQGIHSPSLGGLYRESEVDDLYSGLQHDAPVYPVNNSVYHLFNGVHDLSHIPI